MQSAPPLRLTFRLSPSLVVFIVVSHGLAMSLLPLLALHWAACWLLGWLILLAAIFSIWQLWHKSRWLLCWQHQAWFVAYDEAIGSEAIKLQLSRPPLLLPFLVVLYFNMPATASARFRGMSLLIAKDATTAPAWRQLQRLLRFDAGSSSPPTLRR